MAIKDLARRKESMEREHFQPLGGNDMPRFGGPGTMLRLPARDNARGLDACFVGVPIDIGTSNRSGTRFGPRQIRANAGAAEALQHGNPRSAPRLAYGRGHR